MKYDPEITVHATRDDIPVRGNAMASGDDAADRACEDRILARLDGGDIWAWASVEIRAEFRGLSASTYLGTCSYASEDDFKASAYYPDMVADATEDLRGQLADLQGAAV